MTYVIFDDQDERSQRLTAELVRQQVKFNTPTPVFYPGHKNSDFIADSGFLNTQVFVCGDKAQYKVIVVYPDKPDEVPITIFDDQTPLDLVFAVRRLLRASWLQTLHKVSYPKIK